MSSPYTQSVAALSPSSLFNSPPLVTTGPPTTTPHLISHSLQAATVYADACVAAQIDVWGKKLTQGELRDAVAEDIEGGKGEGKRKKEREGYWRVVDAGLARVK